jgi:hypothetical protein
VSDIATVRCRLSEEGNGISWSRRTSGAPRWPRNSILDCAAIVGKAQHQAADSGRVRGGDQEEAAQPDPPPVVTLARFKGPYPKDISVVLNDI